MNTYKIQIVGAGEIIVSGLFSFPASDMNDPPHELGPELAWDLADTYIQAVIDVEPGWASTLAVESVTELDRPVDIPRPT